MTTLPGWAYPVIISMGTGWGQMGLGQRGAGEPYPAAWARARLFPSKWEAAAQEIIPRWIPAGFRILWNYCLSQGALSPGRSHPRPLPSLSFETRKLPRGPLLFRPGRWNGPAWFPISSTLEIRRPTESQPSLPLGGWGSGGRGALPQEVQVCEVGGVTESKWTCSGSGPMIMSKMETCLGHLQALAKD